MERPPVPVEEFTEAYLEEVSGHLRGISATAIARVGNHLLKVYEQGAQVLVAGNGGSASTASHVACDLGKTVLGSDPAARTSRFRVVSLADNVALLTAWANDVGYDAVFAEQVKMLGRSGDVLLVVSASGNSQNVVDAVLAARALGLYSIAFLGFDGGRLKDLVDDYVLVPCDDYGHVESAHLVLGHLLTSWLRDRLEQHAGDAGRAGAAS